MSGKTSLRYRAASSCSARHSLCDNASRVNTHLSPPRTRTAIAAHISTARTACGVVRYHRVRAAGVVKRRRGIVGAIIVMAAGGGVINGKWRSNNGSVSGVIGEASHYRMFNDVVSTSIDTGGSGVKAWQRCIIDINSGKA